MVQLYNIWNTNRDVDIKWRDVMGVMGMLGMGR